MILTVLLGLIISSQCAFSQNFWEATGTLFDGRAVRSLAAGDNGIVAVLVEEQLFYSSSNNGDRWLGGIIGPDFTQLNSIAIDENGFAWVASNRGLHRTQVGTSTQIWNDARGNVAVEESFVTIVAGAQTAMAVSTNEKIYLSSNAGQSWTAIADQGGAQVLFLANTNDVFAAADEGVIRYSFDSRNESTFKFHFLPSNTFIPRFIDRIAGSRSGNAIVVSGSEGPEDSREEIHLTTDGGGSWTRILEFSAAGSTTETQGMSLGMDGEILVSTVSHGVFYSSDYGNHWTQAVAGLEDDFEPGPLASSASGQHFIGVGGARAKVFRSTGIQLPVSVESQVPVPGVSLAVYPDPVARDTEIMCSIPRPGLVKLVVHNSVGERVAVLFDAWREAEDFRVKWNGRDYLDRPLAAGSYFISLRLDGLALSSYRAVLLP